MTKDLIFTVFLIVVVIVLPIIVIAHGGMVSDATYLP